MRMPNKAYSPTQTQQGCEKMLPRWQGFFCRRITKEEEKEEQEQAVDENEEEEQEVESVGLVQRMKNFLTGFSGNV